MNEVGTLKKGLDILWLIIERGGMNVQEIMGELPYNRSTMYRLISTLEQNDFIYKTENNEYVVSSRLVETIKGRKSLLDFESNPKLLAASERFREETGETIYVGILRGEHVIATHVIPGSYSTRTHFEKGEELPALVSAVGKTILAGKDENEIQPLLQEYPDEDQEKWLSELRIVSIQGYALDNEETEAGVRCIAAPILYDGSVIGAIAISGPSARLSEETDKVNSELVKRFSKEITNVIS